jgi:hypothetical protein
LPISETLPKRELVAEEESPRLRLPVRELEKAEFENDVLCADDPPNWRLSKFDMARDGEIADPLERDEFIAIDPPARLDEFSGMAPVLRSPPNELEPVSLEAIALLLPPRLAAPEELPKPCHWPSDIAGRADDRAAPLVPVPFGPREPGRTLE